MTADWRSNHTVPANPPVGDRGLLTTEHAETSSPRTEAGSLPVEQHPTVVSGTRYVPIRLATAFRIGAQSRCALVKHP